MTYKFQKKLKDPEIQNIQREIEDNFATRDEVTSKAEKSKEIIKSEPRLSELNDGDEKWYDDGSNIYFYKRVGSRLVKFQGTEVT